MRYAYQAYTFLQFIDFARFCGSGKAFTPIRQKQRANKNTGVMPVFFTERYQMRLIVVSIMVTLLSGCAASLVALYRGRGMATNIIPVAMGRA